MKLLKTLTPYFLLGMAVCVAAGAIFVTVQAASQKDEPSSTEGVPAIPNLVVSTDQAIQVAPTEQAAPAELLPPPNGPINATVVSLIEDEQLDPSEVRNSRQHNIRLNFAGDFNGRLSVLSHNGIPMPAARINVRIIRAGLVVDSTVTDDKGTFSFSGLSEGVVALIATSTEAILLTSVRLVNHDSPGAVQTPPVDFHSIVVAGADFEVARQLILQGLPERDRRFNEAPTDKEKTYKFGTGEASTSLSHHQVQLNPDGGLAGQINIMDSRTGRYREVLDLTLHVIHDGTEVAQAKVLADGSFSLYGLTPGVHSLVGTGSDGTLALGFEIVETVAALDGGEKYKLTLFVQGADLGAAAVDAGNFNQQNFGQATGGDLGPGGPGGAPGGGAPGGGAPGGATPGGGTGGGGSGGGGSGGGGGGLGALAGLAAGAAAGAALSGGDAPASPAR